MSHVDEGLIHAYIDGAFPPGNEQGEEIEAHIALCVDCRVRLEKARELKERAQVVLHRLAPDAIATPPFEEVLARRERERDFAAVPAAFGPSAARSGAAEPPKRRRSDVFPIPFAWAATLILAVGAGWMGRELMLNRGAADTAPAAATVQSEMAVPESGTNAPQAVTPAPLASDQAVGGASDPERAREQGGQQQPTDAPAASGFAAPVAAKASDSVERLAEARRDSSPVVLQGVNVAASPAPPMRQALGASVSAFTLADSADAASTAARVMVAYVRASAEERWTAEPFAGLIGYEPVARVEGLEPLRSERAVVDSIELLRTVYAIDGDTVEVVQQLEPTTVALDEIVVTGVTADDSAAMRQARGRTPPQRAAAARAEAAPEEAAGRWVAEVLDTGTVLESQTIVMLRDVDRTVLLLSRLPEADLRALAGRIR